MVKKYLVPTLCLLSIFILISNSFAEQPKMFQDEAVKYRLDGLAAQQKGDLDKALENFQKAISIEPTYVVAHNDLGIIYEEKGWLERAESEYLESLKIDPNYLPAYTNLALLYENMGNIDQAIYYWRQRASLGLVDDSWTIKARENLKRLNAPLKEQVVIDKQIGLSLERELLDEAESFSRSVALDKETTRQITEVDFMEYKSKGEAFLEQGQFEQALEQFRKARSVNPQDQEINMLAEDAESKFIESLIVDHFNKGISFYQQRDIVSSKEEFKKILNILSTILEGRKKEKTYTTITP